MQTIPLSSPSSSLGALGGPSSCHACLKLLLVNAKSVSLIHD